MNLSVLKNDPAKLIRVSTLLFICQALDCEVGDCQALDREALDCEVGGLLELAWLPVAEPMASARRRT